MKKLIATVVLLGLTATATAEDRFADIRQIWPTCTACHGVQGQGVGGMPALAGKDADYIITALTQYKNKEQRGPLSSLMWQQASTLTEGQIGTIGVYIQQGMPNK